MILITADLHLTDDLRHEYRWEFLEWVKKLHLGPRGPISDFFILGDLTEKKSGHSAAFVNRLVDELYVIGFHTVVLKGNHDYIDESTPFFKFLSLIPNLEFVVGPAVKVRQNIRFLFLPHMRSAKAFEASAAFMSTATTGVDIIFAHQTFDMAVLPNGFTLDGMSQAIFSKFDNDVLVFSGDIHLPQVLGRVEYVGAPYPIQFGDNFQPRVLTITPDEDGDVFEWIDVPTIRKVVIKGGSAEDVKQSSLDLALEPGDEVKVVLSLLRSEFACWEAIRREVVDYLQGADFIVRSVEIKEKVRHRLGAPEKALKDKRMVSSKKALFDEFCDSRKLAEEVVKVGGSLLTKV